MFMFFLVSFNPSRIFDLGIEIFLWGKYKDFKAEVLLNCLDSKLLSILFCFKIAFFI